MRLSQVNNSSQTVAPRYDAETVRQVLARAAELEQAEQDRLTATQVEQLGRDIGLRPEVVRRALGEVTGTTVGTVPITTHPMTRIPLRKEVTSALLPGLIYGLLTGVCFYWGMKMAQFQFSASQIWAIVCYTIYFFIPPIIAFFASRRQQDWRLGALTGLFLTTFTFWCLVMSAGLAINDWRGFSSTEWFWVNVTVTAAMVLGAIAPGWERTYRRQRGIDL